MQLDEKRHYATMTRDDILQEIERDQVHFIALWFTDIMGIVKSVTIPAAELDNVIDNGLHFDGSSIEGYARVAESDMVLVPDLATYAVLPWYPPEERTARLICTVHTTHGDPFIGDPRNALIRALRQAEAMDFAFKTGMELEFFLFPLDKDRQPIMDSDDDHAGYFDIVNDDVSRVMHAMLRALRAMNIRVDSTHSETGVGQHEIGFQYAHALVSADTILTSRVVIRTLARQHNLLGTFMPRPAANMPGSGMHTHQSLHDCKTGENRFVDADHAYRLSDTARHFLAGQLAHARGMSALLSPLVNSYKRLGTSFEAPVYVTWAHVNRGALIRVPSTAPGKEHHTRLELRCPDPASNPYLAMTAMLAAGLDGIRHRMTPPDPLEETLLTFSKERLRKLTTLPANLGEALNELAADDVILEALGAYISDRYIAAKRQEFEQYSQQVTPWELNRYLTRY